MKFATMRFGDAAAASPDGVLQSASTPLLLSLISFVLFVTVIVFFRNYFTLVDKFGDNQKYITIALSIQHWNFQNLQVKAFWGLPYLMAAMSLLTEMSGRTVLLLISLGSSFASILLATRLWGVWIAGLFAVINFTWMQRSFLGGAEPLFILMLFSVFVAVRKERWLLAALLASLDTLVRPLGVFALLAIGVTLLWRREYKTLSFATLIGLVVGSLYIIPFATYLGNAFLNVSSYQHHDWVDGTPIGWPFYAIIKGTSLNTQPWTNLLLNYGWVFLTVVAAIAMLFSRRFHAFARNHPVEMLFATSYLVFLFCYSATYTLGAFPRYVLPALPIVLVALDPWIPKNWWLLWGVGIVSPILAAASAIGINNVIGLL